MLQKNSLKSNKICQKEIENAVRCREIETDNNLLTIPKILKPNQLHKNNLQKINKKLKIQSIF
jgi:hypothetical protein